MFRSLICAVFSPDVVLGLASAVVDLLNRSVSVRAGWKFALPFGLITVVSGFPCRDKKKLWYHESADLSPRAKAFQSWCASNLTFLLPLMLTSKAWAPTRPGQRPFAARFRNGWKNAVTCRNRRFPLISAKRHKMPTPKIKSEDMPIVFGFARAVADKVGLDQRRTRHPLRLACHTTKQT